MLSLSAPIPSCSASTPSHGEANQTKAGISMELDNSHNNPMETEERIQKAAAALLEASNGSDIGGFGHGGGGGGLVRLNPVDLYPSLTLSRVPLHYHL
uniref:Uncharacterized protein n=1 Tax=Oryza nivara TaxID=4536 RepID=A0A0E0I4W4_ORYNI